jgi:short-subunit dehydrogenase
MVEPAEVSGMTFAMRYGPWALVVGASDGLGAAFADELAARGVNVVLAARRATMLDDVALRLRTDHGIDTRVVAVDVAAPDGVSRIVEAIESLDIGLLVCNPASGPIGPFLELTPEQLDATLELNCRSAARLTHAIGPRLVARGRGGIVLLGSVASMQGTALVAQYAATKAYLRVLAEGLWSELKPLGVDVLACCPGLVRTPTYEAGAPSKSRLAPAPMTPRAVARQTFDTLGRQPVLFAGLANRLGVLALKFLPRRTAITLVSSQTRAMYPPPIPRSRA